MSTTLGTPLVRHGAQIVYVPLLPGSWLVAELIVAWAPFVLRLIALIQSSMQAGWVHPLFDARPPRSMQVARSAMQRLAPTGKPPKSTTPTTTR